MLKRAFICWLVVAMTAGASVGSCAPAYDDVADKMLVDTQKQADDGLLKLESLATIIESGAPKSDSAGQKAVAEAREKASYASNIAFYAGLQSSLSALTDRMTALPDLSTPSMSNALAKLQENVGTLRKLHADKTVLSALEARTARQILDQQFKTLTVYEVTLKSGSSPK
jgi:hypothetical protein